MTDTQLPSPRWDARKESNAHNLRADGTPWRSMLPAQLPVRRAMLEIPAVWDQDGNVSAEDLSRALSEGTRC